MNKQCTNKAVTAFILSRDDFTIGELQRFTFEVNLNGSRDDTIKSEGLPEDATFDDYVEQMKKNFGDRTGIDKYFDITFKARCAATETEDEEQDG